jgi:hypothetical protein
MPIDASPTMIDNAVRGFLGYGLLAIAAALALVLILGNGALLVHYAREERKRRKPRRPKVFRTRGQEAVHASHFA